MEETTVSLTQESVIICVKIIYDGINGFKRQVIWSSAGLFMALKHVRRLLAHQHFANIAVSGWEYVLVCNIQ